MTDKTFQIFNGASKRLADMGDGTHADVVQSICPCGRFIDLGRYFEVSHFDLDVANAASINLLITTAAGQSANVMFEASAGGDAQIDLFEGPTVSDIGTALAAINRNRVSANAALTAVSHTPTISADGTSLASKFIPGGSGFLTVGGAASCTQKWVFKPAEQYLMRLTNRSGSGEPLGLSLMFTEPE